MSIEKKLSTKKILYFCIFDSVIMLYMCNNYVISNKIDSIAIT